MDKDVKRVSILLECDDLAFIDVAFFAGDESKGSEWKAIHGDLDAPKPCGVIYAKEG